MTEGYLRNLQIVPIITIGQRCPHVRFPLPFIATALLLAGFVKGALGLGLPTVAMGLLAVSMPPAQAIAIVIVPAIVTNIWQTFGGPYLRDIFRRLWPLLTGTAAGIWLNAGSLTGPYARYTTIALGLLLAINAIIGLCKFDFTVARRNEKWVGGIVGLITGMISAATGVQVIPSVPFLQAIGMEKEELIQALGVFFTVATLALGLNLTGAGLLTAADRTAGRGRHGRVLCRHVYRTGGADAAAAGYLPALVPDRHDCSRPLSRQQCACETDVVTPPKPLRKACEFLAKEFSDRRTAEPSAPPASRRGCRDRRTARRAPG